MMHSCSALQDDRNGATPNSMHLHPQHDAYGTQNIVAGT
jgi:hypothetical protein